MKKLLTLLSILVAVALFAGCAMLPTVSPVDDKVTQAPQADLFNFQGADYREGEVLVKVHSMDILNKLNKNGANVLKEWSQLGWALLAVPTGETTLSYIEKLNKDTGIILAQPNMRYTIDPISSSKTVDPSMGDEEINAVPGVIGYDLQWGFQNINAEAAWDITTGSENVIVAIVDTGVDVTHDEFSDKVFIGSFDTTTGLTGDEHMYDLNGHGTHVAGIAADNGNNGLISGVAWDCPIMPIRVENDNGSIWTTYLIDAMIYLGDYAQTTDKRIVANMSIGGRGYNFAFKDAIDYAFENGVLLVTSAGNDSKRIIGYPSAYNGVVSVCASTPYNVKADFSTQGWWNSVAAPGVDILSTVPGGYTYMQGTSMASPFVCGAAALLLTKYPDITPLQIKNQLEMTAQGDGFNEQLGYGVIDMVAMLGDIQPMQYGSLDVVTNILPVDGQWLGTGVVTVFNADGNLVGFGTTGEFGDYLFHAMKPGTYTVTVSFYDPYRNTYLIETQSVDVVADSTSTVSFNLDLPTAITVTNVYTEDIVVIEEPFLVQLPITIVTDGTYEFVTSLLTNECDTELVLFTADGTLIAYNDDYVDRYSYITINLTAGDYVVSIQDFATDDPFDCRFDINSIEVEYSN